MNKVIPVLLILFFTISFNAQAENDSTSVDKKVPKTSFKFGGAVWVNYSYQNWITQELGRKRGLQFDNIRLSLDGAHGDHLLFSAQYRIYGYTSALHHAWIGVKPNENNQIELGVTQVPFGILPFATHSYWFGLGYYHGIEDDYDAGIKWYRKSENLDFHLAFFYSEEYGNSANLSRYSVDLVRSGEQQNEEFAQGNLRIAYLNGRNTDSKTEVGLSAEVGGIDYIGVKENGYRWQTALHYSGRYKGWNPELQIARYEYNPVNPDSVSTDLVLMGNLTSKRLVAAKATVFNANLRHFWDVDWGFINAFNAYINYSTTYKDVSSFKTSQLVNPGCVLEAGPFYMYIDFLLGKNAWYLNDSEENSGPGPGGTDEWEYRFNINFEWYF